MKNYLDLKWLSLILLNLLTIFVYIQHESLPTGNLDLSPITQELKTIQTQLEQPTNKPDLLPINQNLNQLNKFIQQLQDKDDHQLGEMFTTNQIAIKKELKGINELLQHLNEKNQPIKMLPVSHLPFTVLSIDSLQEVSIASVIYQYKTQALEKGDSLAGWTALKIDFAKQIIEFENTDKAHVLVHLNRPEMMSHD